mgnify:CR=1 FL=1
MKDTDIDTYVHRYKLERERRGKKEVSLLSSSEQSRAEQSRAMRDGDNGKA